MMGPMSSSSVFGGLVGLMVLVAILALVAGGALSGSDLLNPKTSDAMARERLLAAQSKAEKDALEIKLQTARAEAELIKIRQETEARQRENEQAGEFAAQRHQYELAQAQRRDDIVASLLPKVIGAGALALLAICGGLTYYLIQAGNSRLVSAQAKIVPVSQIRRACTNELAKRIATLPKQTDPRPTPSGNGKHPPQYEPAGATHR